MLSPRDLLPRDRLARAARPPAPRRGTRDTRAASRRTRRRRRARPRARGRARARARPPRRPARRTAPASTPRSVIPPSSSGTATRSRQSPSAAAASRWWTTRARTTTSAPASTSSSHAPRTRGRRSSRPRGTRAARRRDRRLHADHRLERVDVGEHRLGGVQRLREGLGQHERDRLADVPHHVGREDGSRRTPSTLPAGRPRRDRESSAVTTATTPGIARASSRAMARRRTVRDDGPDEDGPQGAAGSHRLGVSSLAPEEARVLDPMNDASEDRGRHAASR